MNSISIFSTIIAKRTLVLITFTVLSATFTGCGSDDNAQNYRCVSHDYEVLECHASDVIVSVIADETSYDVEILSADCNEFLGSVTIMGYNRDIGIVFSPSIFSPLHEDINYTGNIEGEIRYAETEMVDGESVGQFIGYAQISDSFIDETGLVEINVVVDGDESNLNNEPPRTIQLSMMIDPEIAEKTDVICDDVGE